MKGPRSFPRWLAAPLLALAAVRAAFELWLRLPQRDFDSFLQSASNAAAGHDPYRTDGIVNANPPISLLLFRPLTHFSRPVVFATLEALIVLAFVALFVLLRRRFTFGLVLGAWMLALDGVWETFRHAQLYAALALLATAAWIVAPRRPWIAGLLLGAIAILKPNFLVAVAIALVAGHLQLAVVAGLAWAVGSAIPCLVFGSAVHIAWLHAGAELARSAWLPIQVAIGGIPARVGAPWLSVPLAIGFALCMLAFAWRMRPDVRPTISLGIVTAILVGPISWTGYTLMLLPFFLSRDVWSRRVTWAAALLLLPDVVLWRVRGPLLPLGGSLYTTAMLLVLAELVSPPTEARYAGGS